VVIFASIEDCRYSEGPLTPNCITPNDLAGRKRATPILLFSSRKTAKNPSLPELETFQEERGWQNPG